MPDGEAGVTVVVGVDDVAVEWERLRVDALIQSCFGVFCSLRRMRRLMGGCEGAADSEAEDDGPGSDTCSS